MGHAQGRGKGVRKSDKEKSMLRGREGRRAREEKEQPSERKEQDEGAMRPYQARGKGRREEDAEENMLKERGEDSWRRG